MTTASLPGSRTGHGLLVRAGGVADRRREEVAIAAGGLGLVGGIDWRHLDFGVREREERRGFGRKGVY